MKHKGDNIMEKGDTPETHEHAIGRRIRKLRKARQLTQEALAEMAQMSREYLSKIENGSHCSRDMLSRIAKPLAVKPSFLIMGRVDSTSAAMEIANILATHNAWEAFFLLELVRAASRLLKLHHLFENT